MPVQAWRLLLFVLFLGSGMAPAAAADDPAELRQLVQLAEYVGVDYAEAVDAGRMINAGEYREMVEFAALLADRSRERADTSADYQVIAVKAQALQQAVLEKRSVDHVRQLSAELRGSLLAQMPNARLPDRLLPVAEVEPLFQENCAACHGVSGQGDGPLAAQLEPPPTDFTDRERALNRSVLGLFDAISYGINDTAMTAFTQLSDQQRWSLAFYAGSLAFQSAEKPPIAPAVSLQQMVYQNPAQLAAGLPDVQKDGVEWLRANPQRLFAEEPHPLAVARSRLAAAHEAHQRGDYAAAGGLAVSAYLDGFELVENSLDARDKALRKDIEANMMRLRGLMNGPRSGGALDDALATTLQQLHAAERLLAGSALSAGTLFTASLVILVREGLEALLVVIALMTILVKTERRDALRYVHLGWVAALVAGGATWAAAQSLITISGASREVMEGVAALLAALVLFYVGVWMHSKTHAAQWQAYIQRHIDTHLKSGTLWGLTALAFIAVYREVFETVLFYQSLLTQAVSAHYSSVAGGFVLGVVLLAVLAWLLIRYSVRLPIGRFFASTTYLLLALSFVLIGKAVLALQEADVVGISPLPVSFEIDWIGVKSTWQGMLAQTLLLVAFMVLVIRSKLRAQKLRTMPAAPE